jgi:Arm DNA-binding domain
VPKLRLLCAPLRFRQILPQSELVHWCTIARVLNDGWSLSKWPRICACLRVKSGSGALVAARLEEVVSAISMCLMVRGCPQTPCNSSILTVDLSIHVHNCLWQFASMGGECGGEDMGKAVKKLSARAVATVTQPGRHSDGDGLYLNVTRSGARSWLFMWKRDDKRREMGLGSASSVSLARARELASACRAQVAVGLDPIEARDAAAEIKPEKPTFGAIADALIAAKKSSWRNEKHQGQWRASLTEFAAPLRFLPVDEIDTTAVLAVLTPLWRSRPETASRLRGRIEAVLDAGKAQGHRSGENPARWRGHLSHLLPRRQKLSRGHFAALPYRDVPSFMARLREREAIAAMALNSSF